MFTQQRLVAAQGNIIGGRTVGPISLFNGLAINDPGTVAFSDFKAIFTQQRVVAALGDTIDGTTLIGFVFEPSINNHGIVAFSEDLFCGNFTQNSLLALCAAQGSTIIEGKTINALR